jgi:hypothetical protein
VAFTEIILRSLPGIPAVGGGVTLGAAPSMNVLRSRCDCIAVDSRTDRFFFWRQDSRVVPNGTDWVPVREIPDGQ